MIDNWANLLIDNMHFWYDNRTIERSCEAIRVNLMNLNNVNRQVYFKPYNLRDGDGFSIFGFIDNTLTQTCRPGEGPIFSGEDGVGAYRNDPLIQ